MIHAAVYSEPANNAGGSAVQYLNSQGGVMPVSAEITQWFSASAQVKFVTGTNGADYLQDNVGGATLSGGYGDDNYVSWWRTTQIVEHPGQGIDTFKSTVTFNSIENIENFIIAGHGMTGFGNDQGNLFQIIGDRNTVIAGRGNDVISDEGGGGNVLSFSRGSDHDVVYGFKTTGNMHDLVQLTDYDFTNFGQIRAAMQQIGADVKLTLSANDSITFRGATIDGFSADDFLLRIDLGGLHRTFSDEFNSVSLYNASTGTGTWKTNFITGAQDGWGSYDSRTLTANNEKQIYVDAAYRGDPAKGSTPLGLNPFSVADGVLTITAAKASTADSARLWNYGYTSGLLTTEKTFAQTYGYFEVRADLPAGQGVWPAFWLLPAAGGWPPEIDVFEQLGHDEVYHNIHTKNPAQGATGFTTYLPTNDDGFHTYGLLWTKDTITWYIDGIGVASVATPDDMHQPMYMLLNLAIGGNWPGNPDASFTSAQLNVDYIRAYALNSDTGPDASVTPVAVTTPSFTLPADVLNAALVGNGGGTLIGNALSNILTGGDGSDFIDIQQGGTDHVFAGSGDDGIYAGGALTAADRIDGGAGTADQLGLQGNYALTFGAANLVNVETLALLTGADTRFGAPGGALYSYALKTVDANIAAGGRLIVNFAALRAGENVSFDGSAETDASFTFYCGLGIDTLIGGAGNDGFFFGNGGRFTSADRIDGGGGADNQIGLCGDYSAGLVLGADTLKNVQTIALLSSDDYRAGTTMVPYQYALTSVDANVAAGAQMTISAVLLAADEWVVFDGSAERDGTFRLFGGAGNDTLTGGTGGDAIYGNRGADVLTGGGGNDTFLYRSAEDSTAAGRDVIRDLQWGDRIDLTLIDAIAGTSGNDAFRFVGANAFSGLAGELRLGAAADGSWLLEGDVNGDGVADLSIALIAVTDYVPSSINFIV